MITVYVYLCVWTFWGQFYFIQMKTVLEKVIHFWCALILRLKIACRFCISIYSTWHELHKSVQYLVTCYPIWQRSKNICALPGLFGFPHFPVIVRWDGDQASAESVAPPWWAASNYCNALWFVGCHLYGGALNPSRQWLMFDTPELPKIFLKEHIFNILCMKTWLWCQQHGVLPFMLFQEFAPTFVYHGQTYSWCLLETLKAYWPLDYSAMLWISCKHNF